MFWNRFRRTPKPDAGAEWAKDLDSIRAIVHRAPHGSALDPEVIATLTKLPLGEVIALLRFLMRHREGKLELRVVDDQGREVASYKKLSEIPESVEDQFGDVTRVMPENVELVFRTSNEAH